MWRDGIPHASTAGPPQPEPGHRDCREGEVLRTHDVRGRESHRGPGCFGNPPTRRWRCRIAGRSDRSNQWLPPGKRCLARIGAGQEAASADTGARSCSGDQGPCGLRLIFLGQIAGRLLELGKKDRASKILRDGQAVAKELSTAALAGFGRGAFAEDLGRIDMPAVLELVRGLTDEHEFDRHHGNIAQRAGADTAGRGRASLANAQAAHHARRLRRSRLLCDGALRPSQRAAGSPPRSPIRTRGHTHWARWHSHSPGATRRAPVSFSKKPCSLGATAAQEKETYLNTGGAASTAATLLEVVDRIDRDRVPEFLWRALALPDRGWRLNVTRSAGSGPTP